MSSATPKLSTKFIWNTYEVPRWPPDEAAAGVAGNVPEENTSDYFTIRHLKQGGTGARKTWPAAQVLLDYLVRRGGLRGVREKIADASAEGGDTGVLDLTRAPPRLPPPSGRLESRGCCAQRLTAPPTYNVVELGAGSGYLGVGLALALNREACLRAGTFRPKVQVMCTDNDRATIKNLRHNIAQQPNKGVHKAVRVEPLGWGDGVGGEKFSDAVGSQFREKRNVRSEKDISGEEQSQHDGKAVTRGADIIDNATSAYESVAFAEEEETASKNDVTARPTTFTTTPDSSEPTNDHLRLLTHLIASDVLYGETTLGPLSSVVSALKLRNPGIVVTLLLRERSPGAVADLKSHIEAKVLRGLESETHSKTDLRGFSVSVREVLHEEVLNMKMVEC